MIRAMKIRLAQWLLRDVCRDSGIVAHARRELSGEELETVLYPICAFAIYGHSGGSAYPTIALLGALLRFEPIGPLTGEPSEWNETPEEGLWQNNRCSHVFKDDGGAYDSDGRIFRDPDGLTYTSLDSRVPITFPYTPRSEIVDRGWAGPVPAV